MTNGTAHIIFALTISVAVAYRSSKIYVLILQAGDTCCDVQRFLLCSGTTSRILAVSAWCWWSASASPPSFLISCFLYILMRFCGAHDLALYHKRKPVFDSGDLYMYAKGMGSCTLCVLFLCVTI